MALLRTLKKETIKYHLLFFLIVGLNSGWLTSVKSWVALSTQKENKFQSTKTMAKHTQYTKPRCFDLLYFALFNSSLTKSNNSASSVGGLGTEPGSLCIYFFQQIQVLFLAQGLVSEYTDEFNKTIPVSLNNAWKHMAKPMALEVPTNYKREAWGTWLGICNL